MDYFGCYVADVRSLGILVEIIETHYPKLGGNAKPREPVV
jgi:hypothetical protein